MKKNINKIISIFILISIAISNLPLGTISAYVRPSIAVSNPNKTTVNAGDSVSYQISYSDADEIYLSSSYVTLNGFSANISVYGNGNTKTITLSNIQGTSGNKSISIKANSAQNEVGYAYAIPNSYSFNLVNDSVRPSIAISAPNNTSVYNGGTVVYTVTFSDNKQISKINLSSSYVTLNGFSANVSVSGSGNTRMITLSNINGTAGKKNISIKAGAAQDASGNSTYAISKSDSFTIIQKAVVKPNNTNNKVTKPTTNKNTSTSTNNTNTNATKDSNKVNQNKVTVLKSSPKITSVCNDNIGVLGDINKEVKSFGAWLSNTKAKANYISQNNYVTKNDEVTYYIDYYNGEKEAAKGVKLSLIIPYGVDVLEINGNGYIKSQTAEKTIIEWNKNSIQSEAKCRLYVKVKYLQNQSLEKSNKLSEEFYVTLNTEYNKGKETSNLRQLFVDTNLNKQAVSTKYLSLPDNTNTIRAEDKITRAELAMLLVNSGVVKSEKNSTEYKKYKDAEEISVDARNAVSAMYKSGIIEAFADSEFKPNNPIVRDEFFKIIAKAAEKMSNDKLKVKDSPFIYTDIVDDKDKSLTDNTKYIMELIRQNIIAKSETNPDEYILRKDAIEIINSLTFRGPYVQDLGKNNVKFIDIEENSKYFYNIVGATSTFTYNYTQSLEQQIINIK